MIVLDLEMSGLYPEKHGIWQIGALDLENPENYFIQECRIDDDEEVFQQALDITGKTEVYLRDKNKQSQKQLLENFFKWAESIKIKNCICQNPSFDLNFILIKARKYGLKQNFHYRSFDMHTIAALKYFQLNGKWLLSKNKSHSEFGLPRILEFCGMKDTRISTNVETREVIREGTPHNALEDVKLTAECFSRIVFGKNLIKEFQHILIPDYLRQ